MGSRDELESRGGHTFTYRNPLSSLLLPTSQETNSHRHLLPVYTCSPARNQMLKLSRRMPCWLSPKSLCRRQLSCDW
eukprot:2260750-Rhodomonas_salina.1